MDRHGENSQHLNGAAQRGCQNACIANGLLADVILVCACGAGLVLAVSPFESLLSPHAAPQPQLAYGGATYAVAMVAALLSGLAHNLPVGFRWLAVRSVAAAFLFFPPLVGSFCIAFALNQLAGGRLDPIGIGILAVGLWAVLLVATWMAILRRTTMHR